MQKNRKRKYWGWGTNDFVLDAKGFDKTLALLQNTLGVDKPSLLQPMDLDEIKLPNSKFDLTDKLKSFCTSDKYSRINHTYGKAFRDVWRAIRGQFNHAPDYVAFPNIEKEILLLYEFANSHNIALIPYGGGSSVVGGIEPRMKPRFNGVISVDMQNFDQLLDVDRKSRCARLQSGMYGPALESALKNHGYTLRHFPQSFQFSTLGGWLATHAGGHFATLYTHIDEFVQSVRMVCPNGIIETKRLPGSGAGPDDKHMLMGSEGIYGIITEAWMRVQEIPKHRKTITISFPSWTQGVEACRILAQSGLYPSNARLISAFEAMFNGLGKGKDTLILGFESHDIPIDQRVKTALEICKNLGGTWQEAKSITEARNQNADAWKKSFLQAPYLRDELVKYGFIVETFESCTTWKNFPNFHKAVVNAAQEAMSEVAAKGSVTCRFTHLYPDGPAPYYTIIATSEKDNQLEQWDYIKEKLSNVLLAQGGTITHHHAVGRDHRPYYTQQHSKTYGKVLQNIKKTLDPNLIMNPGVLIPE